MQMIDRRTNRVQPRDNASHTRVSPHVSFSPINKRTVLSEFACQMYAIINAHRNKKALTWTIVLDHICEHETNYSVMENITQSFQQKKKKNLALQW